MRDQDDEAAAATEKASGVRVLAIAKTKPKLERWRGGRHARDSAMAVSTVRAWESSAGQVRDVNGCVRGESGADRSQWSSCKPKPRCCCRKALIRNAGRGYIRYAKSIGRLKLSTGQWHAVPSEWVEGRKLLAHEKDRQSLLGQLGREVEGLGTRYGSRKGRAVSSRPARGRR